MIKKVVRFLRRLSVARGADSRTRPRLVAHKVGQWNIKAWAQERLENLREGEKLSKDRAEEMKNCGREKADVQIEKSLVKASTFLLYPGGQVSLFRTTSK